MTAWMLTYIGADLFPNPSPDQIRFRVAFTVPDQGYQFALLQPCWLFPPAGTTHEQIDEWYNFCQDRTLAAGEDLSENISHHVGLAAVLMREVASVNDGVAPTFQIGVHMPPFNRLISEVVTGAGPVVWQTEDDADATVADN